MSRQHRFPTALVGVPPPFPPPPVGGFWEGGRSLCMGRWATVCIVFCCLFMFVCMYYYWIFVGFRVSV
jgi:hypothetical protein